MTVSNTGMTTASDWTRLLADPDLAQNLGKLLQVYRDAPAEKREEALVSAIRQIKQQTSGKSSAGAKKVGIEESVPQTTSAAPPFEPDIFSQNWGQDRRRHLRIKCFVAVELKVNESAAPVWGNLSNTSRGGCQVETATHIAGGSKVEIGLWVASGKIWVKGIALNGVVTGATPAGGVRVRFEGMNPADKENLKQFLKYVQDTTRASRSEDSYLQLLK